MHEHTGRLAELIPFGREAAISRKDLAEALAVSDRKARAAVENARLDGLIIVNAQNGRGYFQTTDPDEMLRQYRQDTARALSIFRRRKPLREALIAAGVHVTDGGLVMQRRDAQGRFVTLRSAEERQQTEEQLNLF